MLMKLTRFKKKKLAFHLDRAHIKFTSINGFLLFISILSMKAVEWYDSFSFSSFCIHLSKSGCPGWQNVRPTHQG